LLVSLVGYLGLLDLGVRGAVTRYVARFHRVGQHESAGRLASTALAVFSVAGALTMRATRSSRST
jgi:O-antigen/teichoic acid export membrane protein